jgi:hypothetical protein
MRRFFVAGDMAVGGVDVRDMEVWGVVCMVARCRC